VKRVYGLDIPGKAWAAEEGIAGEEILERLTARVEAAFAEKVAAASPDIMKRIEKQVLLQSMDAHWREHLQALDHLRSVVHLRGYAQRDPLNEFKTEAFALFERLLAEMRSDVTRILMNLRVQVEPVPRPQPPRKMIETHIDPLTGRNDAAPPAFDPRLRPPPPPRRDPASPSSWGRVSRNEDCPCGSGKKFKHCHGRVDAAV
jgi:preprotein translocase subunit SecA